MTGPKETAYDDIIAPLMTKILNACKENKINCAMMFALDGDLYCNSTLAIDPDDAEGHLRSRMIKLVASGQGEVYRAYAAKAATPRPVVAPIKCSKCDSEMQLVKHERILAQAVPPLGLSTYRCPKGCKQ